MPVAKEQIRQIIADNNISSVAGVYTLLRDGFKDILQELMEAELDTTLGYENTLSFQFSASYTCIARLSSGEQASPSSFSTM